MEIKRYRIGDLRERINKNVGRIKSDTKTSVLEAKNEFKPVFGKHVPEDNKKINSDAYKEITKETGAYDGGMTKKDRGVSVTPANNRGMSDLRYDSISKPFKEKVDAQLDGYPSAENKKMHKGEKFEGNAYYNPEYKKDIENHAKEAKKEKDKSKTDGLVSSKYKKETEESNDTMFESKKINKLQFKRITFLTEGHMISKIPDEYKVEGKRFIMKDANENEYLVEWHDKDPDITKKINKKLVNEEFNRIKELYNYNSSKIVENTTPQSRMKENKEFNDILDKTRKLMK